MIEHIESACWVPLLGQSWPQTDLIVIEHIRDSVVLYHRSHSANISSADESIVHEYSIEHQEDSDHIKH